MRINFFLCVSIVLVACRVDARPPVARVWPAMGTMMSGAGWGDDSARVARALAAARDSVDRVDSLMQHRVRIAAIDSMQREIRRRTGVALPVDTIALGYALDRAALALIGVVDSALLDLGGQYYWVGPPRGTGTGTGTGAGAHPTHRAVGIGDPDNTLRTIAVVDLQDGSIKTASQRNAPKGSARAVTVLAPDGLTANSWAAAFLRVGCDGALSLAQGGGMHVLCADSTGVRWATGLQNRVSLPAGRAP